LQVILGYLGEGLPYSMWRIDNRNSGQERVRRDQHARRNAAVARRSFLGWALAALLLATVPCAPSSAQTAQTVLTPVIVGPLNSGSATGLYYALQQGLFAKAGLDVKIQPMSGGAAAVAATVGGAINIGYGNTFTVVQAHAKQIPISLVAPGTVYQKQTVVAQLLVSSDSLLKTPADFVGKTIGVTSLNDLAVLAIRAWIENGKVDSSKVNFVEVPPSSAMNALTANRVAAIILYDPFLGGALAQGAKVIANPYDYISRDFLISAWFVSNQWAADHRDAALAFARVLEQVTPYVSAHYAELLPMVSKAIGVPLETLEKTPRSVVATSLRAAQVQPVIDTAARFKAVAATFKAQDIMLSGGSP
jgi:NitT/TauT family transport system substrate-binding protein